jgi:4-alpha-glucanotransferase
MNLPGRAAGNWRFRFSWDQVTPEVVERLATMIRVYER